MSAVDGASKCDVRAGGGSESGVSGEGDGITKGLKARGGD